MTKGYTIFYEGSSISEAEPTIGFGSLRQLPPSVKQVFDSFELIAAPEVAQALAQQAAAAEAAEPAEGGENDGDDVDELLLFWNVS
jgi:alpha-amylase/alpha-mannosidase (GH57 family)